MPSEDSEGHDFKKGSSIMKKTAQFPSMMKCLFVLVHGGLWARKQIQPSVVSEGQSEVLRVLEGMVKVNACPFVVKSDKNDPKVGSGAELNILRMSTDVATGWMWLQWRW